MKLTVEIAEELVARVDRALKAEGLEVREFVKTGVFRLEVANRIGGAPGVPRLLQPDGPELPRFVDDPDQMMGDWRRNHRSAA